MGSFLISAAGFAQQTIAPKALLLKSTITAVGSTSSLVISNEKYRVLQSIGQSGVIGKMEFNNTDVQQGFLTNTSYFSLNNTDIVNFQETFPVVISPNPFVDYIKINFSIKTQHPIHLKIYDISGKLFTNKIYEASESIVVPMKKFSLGTYLVRIVSGKNKYVEKIFKAQ
jgi:hypothetical protein